MIKRLLAMALIVGSIAACRMPPQEKVADDTVKLSPSSLSFEVNQTRDITVTKGAGVTDFEVSSTNAKITIKRDGDTISVTATEATTGNIIVKADTNTQAVATVVVTPDNRLEITPASDTIVGEGLEKTFTIFKGASIGTLTAMSSDTKAVSVSLSGSGSNYTLTVKGVKVGEVADVWVQDDKNNKTPPFKVAVKDLLLKTQTGTTAVAVNASVTMTVSKGKDIKTITIIGGEGFLEAVQESVTATVATFRITGKTASATQLELKAYDAETNTTSTNSYGVTVTN